MRHTFDKAKEDIRPFEGMHEVDRYTAAFPSLEPYFIAADRGTAFIIELINAIERLIITPNLFNGRHFRLQQLRGDNLLAEAFYIAGQIVLQETQSHLDAG